ncbi:AmmeMemoRadiSam system radical SAM enzyme [bacterium]|jgi:pyruvate formate lyase activating enzyme|nr:AmmeMemoRadiSam system radical SAM enzyme [bacterium]
MNKETSYPAQFYSKVDNEKIQCNLCPRHCQLKDNTRGFCFVRKREGDQMVLTTYGRSSGFCIDPIEKKPLNHFHPGTSVLSFGTAGCNLGCQFCQNWDISKSKEMDKLMHKASPKQIAKTAKHYGCTSVAFTYNDPVIFFEYAKDVGDECHKLGIKTVAVSAGYITEEARGPFFSFIDAVNIDLKAFTQSFYKKICMSNLNPVLDTLKYLIHETSVWTEITTLLIPDLNDSEDELNELCKWIRTELGQDVPLHFSAFHPDFRMMNKPATPLKTLLKAHSIAKNHGIKYVYTGNVHHVETDTTYCPKCNHELIIRNWYNIKSISLNNNGKCSKCSFKINGHFETFGNWGNKRLPVSVCK